MTRPRFEVAEIIHKAGTQFIERYRDSLTWAQLKSQCCKFGSGQEEGEMVSRQSQAASSKSRSMNRFFRRTSSPLTLLT
jgi:hypothetical protein